jgi:WD40 repeat protein
MGHSGPVKAVVDLQDDRVLSYSLDGTLRVWDLRESRQIRCFPWYTHIHTLILHPDGKRVLAGSSHAIYLINIEGDLVVRDFSDKGCEDIVLSRDGTWVVALVMLSN